MSRYLGQHFLKNKLAINKIIAALELAAGDTVIEIGPGRGALTMSLIEKCQNIGCKTIGIEKDAKLARSLSNSVAKSFRIIEGDALRLLPSLITQLLSDSITNYKIVGNIPYYITGKLLRVLSELSQKSELTVLMVQKEVAERITAQPPHMNLLAAAVQFWAEPKMLFTLKPRDFDPPPEVQSAVIKLIPREISNYPMPTHAYRQAGGRQELPVTNYYSLIKIIFKQPRKTLVNNLVSGLGIDKRHALLLLHKINMAPETRPQDLSIVKIIDLLELVYGH